MRLFRANLAKSFFFLALIATSFSGTKSTRAWATSSDEELKQVAKEAGTVQNKVEAACSPEQKDCPNATSSVVPKPTGAEALKALAAQIKAGKEAHFEEFLQTWSPEAKNSSAKNPWKDCINPKMYNHPIKLKPDGELDLSCMPDTLYSWGPLIKVQDLEKKMGAGAWEKRPFYAGVLYTSMTPVATYAFGTSTEDVSGGYAIRIKLKDGVKYKLLPEATNDHKFCQTVSDDEAQTTVYVHVGTGIHHKTNTASSWYEFLLCSVGPIHSWSYGTREFYDELSKDTREAESKSHSDELISYITRADKAGVFHPEMWHIEADHHPWTHEQLKADFATLLLESAEESGKVYYNPDVFGSAEEKRKTHFSTRLPSWFNDHVKKPESYLNYRYPR